ncbi:class I SAM-dependent methyltransferase [Hyphomonas sp.]|uniref:class I SAM-dependent methyltransferase n=1 Tax=Hyphomonas sp. TaxID=87 RepID=UPI003919C75C
MSYDATAKPARTDALVRFAHLYEAYLQAEIDMTLSPEESMGNEWYAGVGESGAKAVTLACMSSWLSDVRTVLDMPCGHGRVLRHLVKLFPGAVFDACDIDKPGIEFCASQFGATPILSKARPEDVAFPRKYDVIWIGSLFTHTTQDLTLRWIRQLASHLTEAGIIVATFHGRFSALNGEAFGYIEPPIWRKIVKGYERGGYGYQNYSQPAHDGNVPGDYGISLSKASHILALIEQMKDLRIFNYIERGWAGHHDVLVIGKPQVGV